MASVSADLEGRDFFGFEVGDADGVVVGIGDVELAVVGADAAGFVELGLFRGAVGAANVTRTDNGVLHSREPGSSDFILLLYESTIQREPS